jgi:polyphosphate kinase
MGSADMMGRNLNHRVELLFPVAHKRLMTRLREETLATYLNDNRNARMMHPDGSFAWERTIEPAVDSQSLFLNSSRI